MSANQRARRATVQIWHRDRPPGNGYAVQGVGILVRPDLVLTCAHVAAAALDAQDTDPNPPDGDVIVTFPFAPEIEPIVGVHEPTGWRPNPTPGARHRVGDIAILRLRATPDVTPVALCAEPLPTSGGIDTVCWGYPGGEPEKAKTAICVLRPGDVIGTGIWQRVIHRAGHGNEFIVPGFSGTGLWRESDYALVGMICGDDPENEQEAAAVPIALLREVLGEFDEGVPQPRRAAVLGAGDILEINRKRHEARVRRFLHQYEAASLAGPTRPGVVLLLGQRCDRPAYFFDRWKDIHFRQPTTPFANGIESIGKARLPALEREEIIEVFLQLHADVERTRPSLASLPPVTCEDTLVEAIGQWQGHLPHNFCLHYELDGDRFGPAMAGLVEEWVGFITGRWPALDPGRAGLIFLVVTFDDPITDSLQEGHRFFTGLADSIGCDDTFCCIELFANISAHDLDSWAEDMGTRLGDAALPTQLKGLFSDLPRPSADTPAPRSFMRRLGGLFGARAPTPPFDRGAGPLTLADAEKIIWEFFQKRTGPIVSDLRL